MKILPNHKIDLHQLKLSYELPHGTIAEFPVEPRHEAKMLVFDGETISDSSFSQLPDMLNEGDTLVFNNSRVIHARLIFYKASGGRIEVFCLEPVSPVDMQLNLNAYETVEWKCFVGNAKKWKDETLFKDFRIGGKSITLNVVKLNRDENVFTLRFQWNSKHRFHEIIEAAGIIPLPPYIERSTQTSDEVDYQTVFAKIDGSVAAPTAGLHFSDELLTQLKNKQVKQYELTLHVGAGTFKPIETEFIDEHKMHNERIIVHKNLIEEILHKTGNLIAVGTTSVRSLESVYWLGVRLITSPEIALHEPILQWYPYDAPQDIPTQTSLQAVLDYLNTHNLEYLQFSTEIMIVPGYSFRMIDRMITNFHQPESTLLLLIAAFIGEKWNEVYQHALANEYRFLSFGDGCYFYPKK